MDSCTKKSTENEGNLTKKVCSEPNSGLQRRKRKRRRDEEDLVGQEKSKAEYGYMLRSRQTSNIGVAATVVEELPQVKDNSAQPTTVMQSHTLNNCFYEWMKKIMYKLITSLLYSGFQNNWNIAQVEANGK